MATPMLTNVVDLKPVVLVAMLSDSGKYFDLGAATVSEHGLVRHGLQRLEYKEFCPHAKIPQVPLLYPLSTEKDFHSRVQI